MSTPQFTSGEKALQAIQPGTRAFVHGGAATPHFLLKKMVERAPELWNIELVSISTQGEAIFADKKYQGIGLNIGATFPH